jgi:hypothetical protein
MRCPACYQSANGQVRRRERIIFPCQKSLPRRIPGAQSRIHDNQPLQPFPEGRIDRQGQSKQTAPVLHNEGNIFQVEPFNQSEQVIAVEVKAVIRLTHGFVRAAKSEQIVCNNPCSAL